MKYVLFVLAVICLGGLSFAGVLKGFGLTPAQELAALVSIVAVLLWVGEIVPLFVVGFVILGFNIMVLPSLLPEVDVQVFFKPFFSNIILLFLGGLVISRVFQVYHFDKVLTKKLLKLSNGKPFALLGGVVFLSASLSMWMSNTATSAVVLSALLPLSSSLEESDRFRKALFLAVPFACNIGGFATPIGSPPNAIALSALAKSGYDISFTQWMIWTLPLTCVLLLGTSVLLFKMFPTHNKRIPIEGMKDYQIDWTRKHSLAAGIVSFTILSWLLSSYISVSSGAVAIIPIVLAFSTGLLDEEEFRSLPWDVLFMVGGGISLGVLIQETQLDQFILKYINIDMSYPVLSLFMLSMMVMCFSTIMSNTATAGIVLPVVLSLVNPDVSSVQLALIVTLGCSLAMGLPISTPPNAIAFASGHIKTADMFKAGVLVGIIGIIIGCVAALKIW